MYHMGGWTDIGSGMPRGDAAWSTFTIVFSLSPVHCNLTAFVCYPSRLLLARSFFSLSLSPSLFLFSSSWRTRGPRVSRRALWWLLRWLLASLESSQESVSPPPRVKELPREQVHLLLCLSSPLLLSLSSFLSLSRATLHQPALCPLRFVYIP